MKVIAKKNNIFGWVRNLPDKRVEAILEGDDKYVNQVIEWARIGPANSHVDGIEAVSYTHLTLPTNREV